MRIDISRDTELLQKINEELSTGTPIELKVERDSVVLIRLTRSVRLKRQIDSGNRAGGNSQQGL